MSQSLLKVTLHGKVVEKPNQNNDLLIDDSMYELAKVIEINPTRGTDDIEITESLNSSDLIEFEFDDGTIWISPTQDVPTLFQSQNRSSETTTVIPNSIEIHTESRKIFQKVYLKFVKIFKPQKVLVEMAAEKLAEKVAHKIESKILESEGVNHVGADFKLTPFVDDKKNPSINIDKPILLFLHGTCSSLEGSFGGLIDSDIWKNLQTLYGDNILTLEHRTWSKSPLENALDALTALPPYAKLHLISHSRGGLIGDTLCRCSEEGSLFSTEEIKLLEDITESKDNSSDRTRDIEAINALNKIAKKKKIKVEKFVRVACPAGGTTALTKRVDHFLNILLNLIGYGIGQKTNPLFVGIKSLLVAIVEQRADPTVLPGLEAMIPDSPLQTIFNNHQVIIKSDLSIIAGNAGFGGFRKTLSTILVRLFFQLDNDYVVDTDSMYMGAVRENRIFYKFVDGEVVDHFSYFKNLNTQRDIYAALSTPAMECPPTFKEVQRGERNRNISTLNILPGGSVAPIEVSGDRPIIILIPGIMGSNLSDGDSEIWIDFLKMARGHLSRLNMGNKKVTAKSVVGTSYKQLVDYFTEAEYDICVFPYDWRKSIDISGKQLNKKIVDEFLPTGKPIQIIAHSMGGLVTRDLMINHKETWKKLNDKTGFRTILLGTPWLGAYGIPEVIVGYAAQIKSMGRLALFQSRQDLLKVFVRYQGLLQLLPIHEGAHDFTDLQLWKNLQLVTDDSKWALPDPKDLKALGDYKKKVLDFVKNIKWELDKVIYVAGIDESTLLNFVCRDQNGSLLEATETEAIKRGLNPKGLFSFKKYELVFKATTEGDASVTWKYGFPEQLSSNQRFYMDTTHGELANDPKHFDALKDILTAGSTTRLSQTPPVSRAMQKVVFKEQKEILSNDVNVLAKNILGLKTTPLFQQYTSKTQLPIEVTVKNGHLRFAKYPIMVGHFKDDGIVSAEWVINQSLNGALSEREELGLYPGAIGTNHVHLPENKKAIGAIVIGLGEMEKLTPHLLSKSIEQGCLEYLLQRGKYHKETRQDRVGISTLLIGSNYANLSLSNSLNAILEGIVNANKKVENMPDSNLPSISEIEFIELYNYKADQAYYQLRQINRTNTFYQIEMHQNIKRVDGARTYFPLNEEKEWWKRITAVEKTDEKTKETYLSFSASSGKALIELRNTFANSDIVDALLKENERASSWDRELTKTIFELLIPNDFKISFRDQQNILLILDKTTAEFPWELLNYDENLEKPIVVSAGMIRQLSTNNDRRKIRPVNNKKALIIGDPTLDKDAGIPQLPEAAKEAILVDNLLKENGYDTVAKINQPFTEIFKKLYDEYKIIHIASHGVIEYGEKKKTGILLSDNMVLTAKEIDQISTTPELVFINSCYMGAVNSNREEHFRKKYKLAANVGTQFIENGVKAVVVAGWAVNDAAAKRFAQVFYEKMLDGEIFAEAVKAARMACFQAYPRTNTWGAYQCYGDQYYQLRKKRRAKSEEHGYILEKEILIDLEKLIDEAKSSKKKGEDEAELLEKLQDISKAIDRSTLRNGVISELEIKAYSELREYNIILDKLNELFNLNDATYSAKALEMWCINKIRSLKEMDNKKDKVLIKTELEKTRKRMEHLLELGSTSERNNIMGGIYKRWSLLVSKNERKKAILKSAEHYLEGYEKCEKKDSIYPLTNWIITELLVGDTERIENLNTQLEGNALHYIQNLLKDLNEKENDSDEFWDLVKPVNIQQAVLLFYINEKVKLKKGISLKDIQNTIVKDIKASYTESWTRGGGAARHKTGEIDQMEFIIKTLESLWIKKGDKNQKNIESTLDKYRELLKFFEDI